MSDDVERRVEALGGMSWEAAQHVLRNMRASLYPEGAKRNSEVIAINTVLAWVPYLSAALERAEQERDEARARAAAAYEEAANEWQNVRVEGSQAMAALLAYSDRLRALACDPERDALAERDASVRAEIERLRAALEAIVARDEKMIWGEDHECREALHDMVAVATNALAAIRGDGT